jgi:hypothetical protein
MMLAKDRDSLRLWHCEGPAASWHPFLVSRSARIIQIPEMNYCLSKFVARRLPPQYDEISSPVAMQHWGTCEYG